MDKKCINCKHLKKGRYYTHCELVPQFIIEKKQMYQFVRCNTFREKEYTGIPDSLWKLGPTEPKIRKKLGELTLSEFVNLCKNKRQKCADCPAYHKENKSCGVCVAIKLDVLNNEVEVDE